MHFASGPQVLGGTWQYSGQCWAGLSGARRGSAVIFGGSARWHSAEVPVGVLHGERNREGGEADLVRSPLSSGLTKKLIRGYF